MIQEHLESEQGLANLTDDDIQQVLDLIKKWQSLEKVRLLGTSFSCLYVFIYIYDCFKGFEATTLLQEFFPHEIISILINSLLVYIRSSRIFDVRTIDFLTISVFVCRPWLQFYFTFVLMYTDVLV